MARRSSNKLQSELIDIKGFQQNQIDILSSLSESLSSLQKNIDSTNKFTHNLDIEKLNFQRQMRKREMDLQDTYTKHKLKSIKSEQDAISQYLSEMKKLGKEDADKFHELRLKIEEVIDAEDEKLGNVNKSSKALDTLKSKALDLAKTFADTANKYSELSNNLISITGYSGNDVRGTRSTIVHDIVSQINKETGRFFNPEKSYDKIISIAESANIGSLEVIEEISRPILLATESMNINNTEMASLFSKWYTRYNFSSMDMENLLDDIKGNTAGNNSTAEATRENIQKLEGWMSFYAKGDSEKLEAMSEKISQGTSWLESMGVDTSRYSDYILDIASGQAASNSQLIQILDKSGLSAMQAQSMFESGDIAKLYESLFSGENAILQTAVDQGVRLYSQYSDARSMNLEGMLDSYNAGSSENFKSLEEFIRSPKDTQTMAESIDDKFITLFDRANNWLSSISEHLSNIQERTNIGFSDILTIGTSIVTLLSVGKISKLLGGGKLGGTLLSSIPGLGGGATALGGIGLGTIGAVAGGVALAAGAGYLGYKLGENISEELTALSGNAEVVSSEIESIGESLKRENQSRLEDIVDLNSRFNEAKNSDEQLQLLKESGLFKEEELINKSEEQLQEMINSYMRAASAMDTTTDNLLKTAEKYYETKLDEQQSSFVENMKGITDNQQRLDALSILKNYTDDEKLIEKIEKASKDGKVSQREWNDVLDGGWSKWIGDNSNVQDTQMDIAAMQAIANMSGIDMEFLNPDTINKVAGFYQALMTSATVSKDVEKFDAILKEIEDSGLSEIFYDTYGPVDGLRKSIKGYATGSNYIQRNQLALIHEGEAIVPKRYNPTANATELEMLRNYYRDSSNRDSNELLEAVREFTGVLSDIKEFLSFWREDSIKRDISKEKSNRLSELSYRVSHYNTV